MRRIRMGGAKMMCLRGGNGRIRMGGAKMMCLRGGNGRIRDGGVVSISGEMGRF